MSSKRARNTDLPHTVLAARSWSLAARLTFWYAGSALVLILTATVSMYWALAHNLDVEEDRFIRNEIRDIRRILENRSDNLNALHSELEDELAASGYVQVYARVLDEQGQTIAQTQGMPLAQAVFPSPRAAEDEPRQGLDVTADGKTYFRCLAAQAIVGTTDHPRRYVIQVAMDQAIEFGLLAKYRQRSERVLAVAFFACVFIGYWVARRGIRPIREISRMAQRVQSTTLHERITTRGLPAELLTLANLFNDMLGRLEESFDRLSQFSANIAHELRTPVNNLRGMAEVALRSARSAEEYRDTLGSCLEECVRLSRTIDSLLFLARAEQAQMPIRQEPLNVAEELQIVREFYEAAATAAGPIVASRRRSATRRRRAARVQRAVRPPRHRRPAEGEAPLCHRRRVRDRRGADAARRDQPARPCGADPAALRNLDLSRAHGREEKDRDGSGGNGRFGEHARRFPGRVTVFCTGMRTGPVW